MANAKKTSSAHTAGPWAVFGIKTDAPLIHTVKDGPAGVMVAIVSKEWGTEREKEANSHLIAAAPELLDALEWIVDFVDYSHTPQIKKAQAVIEKAKGE